MPKITRAIARQILNSKGIPTVESAVILDNGAIGIASSPTGTSASKYEAKELRDGDITKFAGLGVIKAVANVSEVISPKLKGVDGLKQHEIDKLLIDIDGTKDKEKLGSNAILSVSMAASKAAAKSLRIPLFAYLRRYTNLSLSSFKIPTPAFNILNGGKHAGNNLDFQEFLIIPATSFQYQESLNMSVLIYQSLKKTLHDRDASTLIGDEGGFAPSLEANRDALVMLTDAISLSQYRIEYDVFLGIDAASNNFYNHGQYHIKDHGTDMRQGDFIEVYKMLTDEYKLIYLEDPFAEDDWDGWENITKTMSKNTMIVGDDLIATNIERLKTAIKKNAINGIIIKPNQIGTVIEAIATAEVAREAGLKIIGSHRSGETTDDFIADFSVAIGANYVKFGAPARGERVVKYNRLLEIESEIEKLDRLGIK